MTCDADLPEALQRMREDFVRQMIPPRSALLIVKMLDQHFVYVCGNCHFVYAHDWMMLERGTRHHCYECGALFKFDMLH